MRRFIVASLVAVLAALMVAAPAAAGVRWCARDPLVRIGGTNVQIWVAIPEQYTPYVKGPIQVRISAPQNLSHQVLSTDSGFNGLGESVQWTSAKPVSSTARNVPLGVAVRVVIDQSKLDKAYGKHVNVPVQAIVNVGTVTQTFTYATTQNNRFHVTLTDSVVPAN
jgi:hypothetical protein